MLLYIMLQILGMQTLTPAQVIEKLTPGGEREWVQIASKMSLGGKCKDGIRYVFMRNDPKAIEGKMVIHECHDGRFKSTETVWRISQMDGDILLSFYGVAYHVKLYSNSKYPKIEELQLQARGKDIDILNNTLTLKSLKVQ